MLGLDLKTFFFDKRDKAKERQYYENKDDLFRAKGRFEYIGTGIIPSWLDAKHVTITVNR